MSDELIEAPRYWFMYAEQVVGGHLTFFDHFHEREEFVRKVINSTPIKVQLTEAYLGHYYAWIETGSDKLTMVQRSWARFAVQFSYGVSASVKAGKGNYVRLEVHEVTND